MDPQTTPQQNISLSGTVGGGEIDIYTYFTACPHYAGFTNYSSPEMQVFLELFRTLPESLRQFLISDTTASLIYSTGKQFELTDKQIFVLAASIRELVTGSTFIKDFPINVSSKLGIDDIKAGEIVNKIVAQSFGPIIEDVKRIQRGKFPDKVMAMQKESQPTGLTQSTARPDSPPTTKPNVPIQPGQSPVAESGVLNNVGTRQDVQSVRPLMPASAPSSVTPGRSYQPPQSTPNEQAPVRPLNPTAPLQQIKPPTTPEQPVPRPQFKMPNLDPIQQAPLPAKQNILPNQPSAKPSISAPDASKPEEAKKSLEDELAKVANIIDLREKSEEK